MRIGVECGKCWYLPRSWRLRRNWIRRFRNGFAVGPIMVVKGKW